MTGKGMRAHQTRRRRCLMALSLIVSFTATAAVVGLVRRGASRCSTAHGGVWTPFPKNNQPPPSLSPGHDASSLEDKIDGGKGRNDPPWRAVPVLLTPARYSGRGLTSDDTPANASTAAPAPSGSDFSANTTTEEPYDSTATAGRPHEGVTLGGPFGVAGDWQDGVSLVGRDGGSPSLRGDACMASERQEEIRQILRRRKETPSGAKVAACVRTKDAGRFLPEWIAYHHVIGVDEITLYDDNSADRTKEILQPFVDAGLAMYLFKEIGTRAHQMQPLNHCLRRHIERREVDSDAPVWVLFHDIDEYILPVQTNQTMSDALMRHPTTCCAKVPRVQYGTSGYQQQPRGLLLETFLKHAHPRIFADNRFPKVAVNLSPTNTSLGLIKPPLANMHDGKGCKCESIDVEDIRINHYLGSAEDYLEKTKRFWKENHSRAKVEKNLITRDINVEESDTITNWACATREILFRVVSGVDIELGLDSVHNTTAERGRP